MERVKIGTITKPQALKGAFRVKPNILNMKKFKKIGMVYIDNTQYEVESAVIRETFVILKVKGIDSCESAETMRNKDIFAEIEVEKDNSFDLVGWSVVVGDTLGKVLDVNNYGSKDILSLKLDKNCMIPLIDGVILNSDDKTQTIYLNKEIFEQVVVYED